ncbi:Protein CBG24063 [Caenorhabditis briggsae]|uniref:Protein CBG24063 n=1 Tax=Caenorhabditis briggsae TaxID=6238 RepID=A8WJW7_CAEBR|nr:Protein CBG24063 [Caenorhabditis briggsae]CAP20760.1 Protein CBG24063 [Caenorhabditis briggsae]
MPSIWAGGCWWAVVGVEPTDGFQRLACLPKAKNQKFSADSYRSRAQNSVTTKPFTVSTGHTTSERNSTDRKTKRKKNNQEQLLDWTFV